MGPRAVLLLQPSPGWYPDVMRWTWPEQPKEVPDEPDVAAVRAFVTQLVEREVLDGSRLRKDDVYVYLDNNEPEMAFDAVLWHLGTLNNLTPEDRAAAVELTRQFKYDLFEGGDGTDDGSIPLEPDEYVERRLRHQAVD